MAELDPYMFWHHPKVQQLREMGALASELKKEALLNPNLDLCLCEENPGTLLLCEPSNEGSSCGSTLKTFTCISQTLKGALAAAEELDPGSEEEEPDLSRVNPMHLRTFLKEARQIIHWTRKKKNALEQSTWQQIRKNFKEQIAEHGLRSSLRNLLDQAQEIDHDFRSLDRKLHELILAGHCQGIAQAEARTNHEGRLINLRKEEASKNLQKSLRRHARSKRNPSDLKRASREICEEWENLAHGYRGTTEAMAHLLQDLIAYDRARTDGQLDIDIDGILPHLCRWASLHLKNSNLLNVLCSDKQQMDCQLTAMDHLQQVLFLTLEEGRDLHFHREAGVPFEQEMNRFLGAGESLCDKFAESLGAWQHFRSAKQSWGFKSAFIRSICLQAQIVRYRGLQDLVQREEDYEETVRENASYRLYQVEKEIASLVREKKSLENESSGLFAKTKQALGLQKTQVVKKKIANIEAKLAELRESLKASKEIISKVSTDFEKLRPRVFELIERISDLSRAFTRMDGLFKKGSQEFHESVDLPDFFAKRNRIKGTEEPFSEYGKTEVSTRTDLFTLEKAYTSFSRAVERARQHLADRKIDYHRNEDEDFESYNLSQILKRSQEILRHLLLQELSVALNLSKLQGNALPLALEPILGPRLFGHLYKGSVEIGKLTPDILENIGRSGEDLQREWQCLKGEIGRVKKKMSSLRGRGCPQRTVLAKLEKQLKTAQEALLHLERTTEERNQALKVSKEQVCFKALGEESAEKPNWKGATAEAM